MFRHQQQQQQQPYYNLQNDGYHRQPPNVLYDSSPNAEKRFEYDFNHGRKPYDAQRLLQNEESGGIHPNDKFSSIQDPSDDEGREGENDVEYIIMNLYSKMKNLENKYIDLANFYKQELVKTSKKNTIEDDKGSQQVSYSRGRNEFSPSRSFERSPKPQNIDQSLEEDMKQIVSLRGSLFAPGQSQQLQQSPQQKTQPDYNQQTLTPENQQKLQEQLGEALTDVLDQVDFAQRQQLKVFSSKQNDMFQLAMKYAFSSQVKNECLGLWYDAKTKVSQTMSELKQSLEQRGSDLPMAKIASGKKELSPVQEQLRESLDALKELEQSVSRYRLKNELQQKNLRKLKHSVNFKDNAMRDDQSKLMAMVQDMQESIYFLEESQKKSLMLSSDKSNSALSPFEKRLANYQKSAEMRKEFNRSGSRGRPTGANIYGNQQQRQMMTPEQEQELRMLKSKAKNIEYVLQDFETKAGSALQEQRDVERYLEQTLHDSSNFIQLIERTINPQQSIKDQRSKSAKDQLTSPSSKGAPDEIRELQRNNDKLFQDLRKANQKYLDQRVENSRLKDQLQILQNAVEDAQVQIKKLTEDQYVSTSSNGRQKIKMKTQSVRDTAIESEVEMLRRRVREFEILSRGDPQSALFWEKEANENRQSAEQLCIQVQRFLLAMKRLQRAVNNKDKDMPIYKQEFETHKRALENLVKEVKDIQDQQQMQSRHHMSYQNRAGPQGTSLMFSPKQQQNTSAMLSYERQNSHTRTQQHNSQAARQNDSYDDSLTMKRGSVRPKGLPPKAQEISERESQELAKVMEELRQWKSEAEKHKRKVEELKGQKEQLDFEKNKIDLKVSTLLENQGQLQQQVSFLSEVRRKHQDLLEDYKEAILAISKEPTRELLSTIYQNFVAKERELTQSQLMYEAQIKQSPSKVNQVQQVVHLYKLLREELTEQIIRKEEQFDTIILGLQQRLQEKEDQLDSLKTAFIEKLRELEASFAEVNEDLSQNDVSHQEAQKRTLLQQQVMFSNKQAMDNQLMRARELETSVEQVMSRYEEEQREEELDRLLQTNQELMAENQELRDALRSAEEQLKENVEAKEIQQKYDTLKEENDNLNRNVEELLEGERLQSQKIKQQNDEQKKLDQQIKENTQQHRQREETQHKLADDLKGKLTQLNKELDGEQTKRVQYEQESKKWQKECRQLRTQFQSKENEITRLHQEIESKGFIQSLHEDTVNEKEDKENKEEEDKMNKQPLEQAQQYWRLLKATRKEYRILEKDKDQLQVKHNDLKANHQELKQDERENAESIITMESKIIELESLKEKLEKELSAVKGDNESENHLRSELEDKYKEILAYKDTEIENLTNKLAKISQLNIDLTTKSNRLETSHQQLSHDYQFYLDKAQNLEMQLEMTKSDQERDTEQILEQKKINDQKKEEQEQKIQAIEKERQRLESEMLKKEQLLNQVEQEKSQVKDIGESLKKQIEEQTKQLEAEKQAKAESELQRQALTQQQEDERIKLLEEMNQKQKEIQDDYENKIKKETGKQEELEKMRKQREQDIIEQHQKERERLEQRLKEEREQQESRLKEGEKEKIERVRKELEEERDRMIKEKEVEVSRQKEEEKEQALEIMKDKLQQEAKEAEIKKDKQSKLLYKLQQHMRKILEEELNELQKQIEGERNERSLEIENLRSEYEAQQKELEELKEQELKMIEDKLQQEQRKAKRSMSLVNVLQARARQTILDELEKQKIERKEKELQMQQEIEKKEMEHDEAIQLKVKENQQRIKEIEQELENKRVQDVKAKEQLIAQEQELRQKQEQALQQQVEAKQKQIEEEQLVRQQKEQAMQKQMESKDKEIEQEKLVRQQKEEVMKKEIETRENEIQQQKQKRKEKKQALRIQLETREKEYEEEKQIRLQKEQDLQKEKQSRDKEIQQEKLTRQQKEQQLQKELEEREKQIAQEKKMREEKEESMKKEVDEKEREKQQLKAEQDELLKKLSEQQDQQSQELLAQKEREKQQIIKDLEKLQKEEQLRYEQQLKQKDQQNSLMTKLGDQVKKELEEKLKASIQEKEEALKQQELTLKEQHQKELQQTQSKTQEELTKAEQRAQEALSSKDKELSNSQTELQKQKQLLEQIQQDKQNDFETIQKQKQEELKKKEKEIEEINTQIQESQYLNQTLQQQVEQLEAQDKQREKDINDLYDQLQDKDDQIQIHKDNIKQLQKDLDKTSKELESKEILKQGQEKLNQYVKELRENLTKKEEECEQIKSDKQELNQKLEDLKMNLKSKSLDYQNMEKDLEEFDGMIKQQAEEIEENKNQRLSLDKDLIAIKLKCEQQTTSIIEKEDQIKALNLKIEEHDNIIKDLEKEKEQYETKIKALNDEIKSMQGQDSTVSGSINALEKQIDDFKLNLVKMQELNDELKKERKVNQTIIEGIETGEENIVGEVGSNSLQYCKKVKYLDKVWILVVKDHQYFWIDQEKLAMEQLQKIPAVEVEEDSTKLSEKLLELEHQKNQLVQMIKATNQKRDQMTSQDPKDIKIERQDAIIQELTFKNKDLQKQVLDLKKKINEYNDIIYGMVDSERSHDNVKKYLEIFEENKDLKNTIKEHVQVLETKESEIALYKKDLESTKKQLFEGDSLTGNQVPEEDKDENLKTIGGDLSKIDNNLEDDSVAIHMNIESDLNLKKMKKLESEKEALYKLNQELDFQRQKLEDQVKELKQRSVSRPEPVEMDKGEFEQLRMMLIQFFQQTPHTQKQNEEVLPIIFSMINLNKREIEVLKQKRQEVTDSLMKQKKGGIFGFGNKK